MPYYTFAHCLPVNQNKKSPRPAESEWKQFYEAAKDDLDPGIMPEQGIMTVMPTSEVIKGDPGDQYNIVGLIVFEFEGDQQAIRHAKSSPILKMGGAVMVNIRTLKK